LRLVWSRRALAELDRLADRAPTQATGVYEPMRWMTDLGVSLGRTVPGSPDLHWPVPPQGVFSRISEDGRDLVVVAIRDARRRRRPWTE
jgi:hypothetical protein